MYLAPQNIPRAISVLTLGNKVILLYCIVGLCMVVLLYKVILLYCCIQFHCPYMQLVHVYMCAYVRACVVCTECSKHVQLKNV